MHAGLTKLYSGIFSSFSGIQAARATQDAAAQNIANANTDNYGAARVELSAAATGGVEVGYSTTPAENFPTYQAGNVSPKNNSVDLLEETLTLKTSERMLEANIAAFKVHEETLGSIIDIAS